MTKHPMVGIIAVLSVVSALTACNRHAAFARTTSITFVQDVSGRMQVAGSDSLAANNAPKQLKLVVTNSAEVCRFVSAIQLERTEPCWCLHVHSATFQTPTKQIEVSFCPHCLDVVENGAVQRYKMPEPFLKELLKQIKAEGQAGWLVPQP